jgi:hypothetical protein
VYSIPEQQRENHVTAAPQLCLFSYRSFVEIQFRLSANRIKKNGFAFLLPPRLLSGSVIA